MQGARQIRQARTPALFVFIGEQRCCHVLVFACQGMHSPPPPILLTSGSAPLLTHTTHPPMPQTAPPSLEELERRLANRNTETPTSMARRMSAARQEITRSVPGVLGFGAPLTLLTLLLCWASERQAHRPYTPYRMHSTRTPPPLAHHTDQPE